MDPLTRRHFLMRSSSVAIGFASIQSALARGAIGSLIESGAAGDSLYGPLLQDPDGILDLPKGFSYRIISPMSTPMDDGLIVPGKHDGMASYPFTKEDGAVDPDRCILIRNHEISDAHRTISPFGARNEWLDKVDPALVYDIGFGRPSRGGCTTVVYNLKEQRVEKHWLSLAGTEHNCAGGATPWGTWISCEEAVFTKGDRFERDHGYCFEVPVTQEPKLAEPKPIKGMGRMNHEAVCVDPQSGIVYLTEDRHDSLIYRFIPNVPERMHEGGKLQALRLLSTNSADTRNWDAQLIKPNHPIACGWITMDEIDSPLDDLRHRGFAKGAARFARGEGMWWGSQTNAKDADSDTSGAYFACTNGGKAGAGQIWKLTPNGLGHGMDALELLIEPNDPSVLQNADNITFSPWGDIFVCEDGEAPQYLVGVRPDGSLYQFAKNAYNRSEFAGVCFSPDGSTMFVNIQSMGWTVAIMGPWNRSN